MQLLQEVILEILELQIDFFTHDEETWFECVSLEFLKLLNKTKVKKVLFQNII